MIRTVEAEPNTNESLHFSFSLQTEVRMFDSKVREKKRKKINSLVQQRMKETESKDEKLVRKQIMKEQRLKSKEKKNGELETIKKQVRTELGECCRLERN